MEWILKCYATMYIQQKSLKKIYACSLKVQKKKKCLKYSNKYPNHPFKNLGEKNHLLWNNILNTKKSYQFVTGTIRDQS